MIISILSIRILVLTITFYISSNPLSIGVIVLRVALTSTLIISLTLSSWICFLVFLIYIGGILVLFSYFVAITPNIPIPTLYINISILALTPIILAVVLSFPYTIPQSSQPELFIQFIYITNNFSMLVILALILFLTIVIVVKLVSIKRGPLRPFNFYV